MDSRKLEYVIAIAEEKSLVRAAERLFVSPSALSQSLDKLEESLGIPLFSRTKAGIFPTEVGTLYLNMAYDILNRESRTLRLIEERVSGKKECFSIGVTPGRGTAMFSAVFSQFSKTYPNVNISLFDGVGHDLVKLLTSGKVDIGFLPGGAYGSNFESRLLVRETLMVAIPRTHPLVRYTPVDPNSDYATIDLSLLRDEEFLLMSEGLSVREITDSLCREAGFEPRVSFQSTSMVTLDNLSQNGYGIAFVQKTFARRGNPEVAYFYTNPSAFSDLCAVYHKDYILTSAQQYLIELAQGYFIKSV